MFEPKKTSASVTGAVCLLAMAACFGSVGGMTGAASAADFNWQGAGTGGNASNDAADPNTWWDVPANWQGGSVPTADSNAFVTFTDDGSVYLRSAVANTFTVDGPTGVGTIRVAEGAALTTNYWYLGNTGFGRAEQTGGTATVNRSLYLGNAAGATGSYHLTGGSLMVNQRAYIGQYGSGTVTQDGGIVQAGPTGTSGMLYMGNISGSTGTYLLNGGQLRGRYTYVGFDGVGQFVQTGGTHSAAVTLGGSAKGVGQYELQGGSLIGGVGVSSASSFVQTGGRFTGSLSTGGTYSISGGSAEINRLTVTSGTGYTGMVDQSGGVVTATNVPGSSSGNLSLSGLYRLSSGVLVMPGDASLVATCSCGNGSFVQTGGTVRIGQPEVNHDSSAPWTGRMSLAIISHPIDGRASTGTYELHDGSLTVDGTIYLAADLGITGVFLQTGGTTNCRRVGNSYLGGERGMGLYDMRGGVLSCDISEGVVQSGGHATIGDAYAHQLSGGVLDANSIYGLDQQGGTATANLLSATAGTSRFAGGQLSIGRGTVGAYGCDLHPQFDHVAGTLNASDGLTVGYGGTFNMSAGATIISRGPSGLAGPGSPGKFSAESGASLHLVGSKAAWVVSWYNSGRALGTNNLAIIVEGQDTAPAEMEVAGFDGGAALAGFTGNFALEKLQIGGSAGAGRARLVDRLRSPWWGGAFYAKMLEINDGSWLDANGLNIYYLNGGAPKQYFAGDIDLNGAVDIGDLTMFGAHWGQTAGARRLDGDLNGDGAVDIGDLALLGSSWGRFTSLPPLAPGESIPEPCSLAMLSMVAGAMFWRRRQVR